MNRKEIAASYVPITSGTRVIDFDLPDQIELGGNVVNLPRYFKNKSVHWLVNGQGKLVKGAWINRSLSHILNSFRFEDSNIRKSELAKALAACDDQISSLIKFGVLRDKHGPGAMAFSQTHENIPKDSVVISDRSWKELCSKNKAWEHASHVMCVRFPNLGPGTTQLLRLIVDKNDSNYNIASRASGIETLLDLFEEEQAGVVDAFYLHPEILKDGLQGDGDGRQLPLGSANFPEIS